MANLGSMTITKDTLSWYQLKGPITIFIPVIEIPFTAKSTSDTFYVNSSDYFDATPPTAKGGMQWLSLKLTGSDGWGSEAQSQWVSMAVDPSYLPYLTRETNTSYNQYRYKWKGTGFAFSGDTVPGNTSRYDTHIWLKDAAGAIRRSTSSLNIGIYAYPKNNDDYTPNNNLLQVGNSHQYSITSPAALSGGGWGNPDSMTDYDRVRTYSALYKGYTSDGVWGFDTSYGIAELNKKITDNAIPVIPNDDPYGDPEDPKDGGGDGAHGKWGDTVGDDPAPTLQLSSTGMVTPYTPTLAQLKSFSQFLWSDAFSVDTFKKMFADPFQAIITCHALPFAVTAGGAANVSFGNIASDVSMNTLAQQYYTIDAGTLNIQEYWGSFFDYSPYTSYMIYLPYVGYKEIKPEDFTTGSITIKYIVDAITGAFTVRLLSSKVNGSALYQYTGDMAYQIPLSKSDYSSIISNVISSAAAIGGGIAALAATGSAATLGSAAMSTVGKVTSSKVQVQRSGSVGGAAGWYASQTPYIIRTRPNPVLASNQNFFVGRPSYQTATLSTLSGYTKVKDIRLSGITGTDSEKAEIESLLKEGVIL